MLKRENRRGQILLDSRPVNVSFAPSENLIADQATRSCPSYNILPPLYPKYPIDGGKSVLLYPRS